ncbi:MAG: Crp/Fnr family transcriptional regulator [Bacteroidetes bacterium]|jgi:CRP/FNR family transcriptional regulator, anaerobic regulatory protein|nr:Crp/Fnr family transcriptional regulator [Bacteroidota bacterium]
MIKDLNHIYGGIFESALIQEINQVGTYREIEAGTEIIRTGEYIKSIPLLLSGAIKVIREYDDGEELLLYYVEEGNTCSMSMSCCVEQRKSQIKAVAELDTLIIMIPIKKMEEWLGRYQSWRTFVFSNYQNRIEEVLQSLERVAFERLDERLEDYLKEKARINSEHSVYQTHKEIAEELHSSRVVISRLLKKLEQMGSIKLHRNHIELINL